MIWVLERRSMRSGQAVRCSLFKGERPCFFDVNSDGKSCMMLPLQTEARLPGGSDRD